MKKSIAAGCFLLLLLPCVVFSDDAVPSGFVLVKAGSFIMGQAAEESEQDADVLQHTVVLTNDFLMAKYELSRADWKKFLDRDPSVFMYPSTNANLPADGITWYDAAEYCNARSTAEGLTPCYAIDKQRKDPNNKDPYDDIKWTVTCNFSAAGYRLPTEAEWEYAARGGQLGKGYAFSGGSDPDKVAWHYNNTEKELQPVGQKAPNELGIYDMSGNAWEWCWDWYGEYPAKTVTDPAGVSSGDSRVMRGGGCGHYPAEARCINRDWNSPIGWVEYISFRLVRTVQ